MTDPMTRLRAAAEDLADAVEDFLFTESGDRDSVRAAWQRYADEAAEIDRDLADQQRR